MRRTRPSARTAMPSWPAPSWRSSMSTSRWPGSAPRARGALALFLAPDPLAVLYGEDAALLFARGLRIVLAAAAERPTELRRLDRRREIAPAWFQRARMQGYVCYVDRFCGTLA